VAAEPVPLTKAKRNEIRALAEGQDGALASVITTLVSAEGFFDAGSGAASPQLLPIVVYEASRLLEAYPDLNAYFDAEASAWARYAKVNVGVAFEIDQGLKVPVLKAPNRSSIADLRSSLDDLIVKYLENRLAPEDVGGATFTVTDLSADGAFTFVPLISRGQCSILGIGGAASQGGVTRVFPLSLAFDHRVSTGRRAARFLAELKGRLESYAGPLSAGQAGRHRRCRQCKRGEADLRERQFLLLASREGKVDYLCTTCARGF
jgi:pyruvate/2-oxoglutarate dehydrogenase complex dihydrolipoamide acyltransferase (E2) component